MSSITAVQSTESHAAIARASAATGVDFDYLLAQARLESGLDAGAKARTSSAAGLYQFIEGTWLETLDRHGGTHGLGWADAAISRRGSKAAIGDPAARAQVMALRYDPDVSALMAAELARDNAAELGSFLGREAEPAELYLAHFLGAGGAREFLGALRDTPGASAASLFPKPAAANRAIFHDDDRARSVSEVMDLLTAKVAAAMERGAPVPRSSSPAVVAAPANFAHAAATFAAGPEVASRPSMAETLRATFGGAGMSGNGAASRIDEAYSRFRAFGL